MAWLETLTRRPIPAPTRRRKRALLAWEFGAGRTHVTNVLGVTRHLRKAGFECLATLYETHTDPEFAALGTSVVQNYVWPSWRRYQERLVHPPADTSLTDFLGNLGFAEPKAVAAMLAHYEGLFRLFEPDIVLAENAFGALLAARGRLPAIGFGFNGLLAPIEGNGFAPYKADGPEPGWRTAELCDKVNEGLARAGRMPLAALSDIVSEATIMPFGPAAFDLYDGRREEPCLPVHVYDRPAIPDLRGGDGNKVFVYLQGFVQQLPAIPPALLSFRRPVHAYLPDLIPHARETLDSRGVQIEDSPIPLPQVFQNARCVLHHGGQAMMSACLAAGLPQVVLSRELDNQVCGRFVREQGLGDECWLWDATTSWIVDAVRRACEDEELRQRCRDRAAEFEGWFMADPTALVAEKAAALLAAAGPR